MTAVGSAPQRSAPLDGLRGIAIALVLAHHVEGVGPHAGDGWVATALTRCADVGWVGVDLFFVLSGFLITGILLEGRGLPGCMRSFYARRALRIFPLYYAYLVAVVAGGAVLGRNWPDHAWFVAHQGWYWAYLQNWSMAHEVRWPSTPIATSHTWSLAIEEQFYLVWPWLVAFCPRRALAWVAAALAAAALAVRCWMYARHAPWLPVYVMTVTRMDALLIGALGAILLHRRTPSLVAGRIAAGAALVLAPIVAVGLLACDNQGAAVVTAGYTLIAALALAAVLCAVLPGCARWQGFLAWRPLVSLGTYSYALYLLHWPVIWIVQYGWARFFTPRFGSSIGWLPLYTLVTIGTTYLVAMASWRWFEGPLLSLKRFVPMPRPPAAAPAAEPIAARAAG